MVGRQSSFTRKFQAVGIVRNRETRQLLRAVVGLKRWGAEHAPQRPDSVDGDPLVPFVCKIVGLNDRSLEGIGGASPDESGAVRPQLVEAQLEDRESF